MNNQEAFTKMVKHLRKQGVKCNNGFYCYYRGPIGTEIEGMKCAVGAIIPDNEINPNWGDGGDTSITNIYKYIPSLHGVSLELLQKMQLVHDSCLPLEWEENLALVARKFGLTMEDE